MKNLLTAIATAVFIIYPSICFASYVIHLKDGRSFTTPEYRQEGDQIKFERYGGLIGIPKDQVTSIEEILSVPEKEVLKLLQKAPVPESSQEAATVSEVPAGADGAEGEKSADQEKENPQLILMKEKRQILMERENISQAFEEAKAVERRGRL